MSQTVYKTNPIVSLDDTQFVSQLYGSGVGLAGAANTKTLTQNEQRIRGMITTDNLDYVSKAGFIKYQAVAATKDVVLNGTYNTLYTIRNTNPVTGIDISIKFLAGTIDVFPSPAFPAFQLPAGQAIHIMVDGVGTPQLATAAEITNALGVIAVSSSLA